MTARVEIDTSEEAAKEIAEEIVRELYGPEVTANKTQIMTTRHIMLTVAAMMERQQTAADREREERRHLHPQTESYEPHTGK